MRRIQRQSLFSLLLPALVLTILLAACGSQGGTGDTGGTGGTGGSGNTGSTPTAATSDTTATGCPSTTVVNNEPTKASVMVKSSDSNGAITARNGDVIAIELPFGHRWSGPTTSQGVLQLQGPAGYASQSDKMCVWRYMATGTGTTKLEFSSKAICKSGELCPMYIMNVPFTITVK